MFVKLRLFKYNNLCFVMNKNNIFIESEYEFKRVCRSILFRIFAILAILGLVVYQYSFLSRVGGSDSINDLFQFYMDWPSQALASSIPFKSAYYFNLIQLLLVVSLVVNDLRKYKIGTKEALFSRPQGNREIVTGNFLGKLLVVTLLNGFVFVVSIIINHILYSHSFNLSYYLFYWITLTFPALVYFLGFSGFMIRWVRNLGMSLILFLLLFSGLTFGAAHLLHGLLDPCARYVPNMFSDFTGHVNLENYLLQRGNILFAGIGFFMLSVISYPRIPNEAFVMKKSLCGACVLFILSGCLAFMYYDHYKTIDNNRKLYRQVYHENSKYSGTRIVRNDLRMKMLEGGGLAIESQMEIVNGNLEKIPLVLYLNPGLKINRVEVDGKNISFRRECQAIILDKELTPGERCCVGVLYEGNIETDICFLEQENEEYDFSDVNRVGISCYGYTPAFCREDYTLLTPESLWYPVCVPPYSPLEYRGVNFTRYSLAVEHDPRLIAISQGDMVDEKEGKTSFVFTHDMPGISLCVGEYRKREITVSSMGLDDSTCLELYYLPRHEYLLEQYNIPEDLLVKELADSKVSFEMQGCIKKGQGLTDKEWEEVNALNDGTRDMGVLIKEVLAKRKFDPTQHYPYRQLTLLETPCDFYCFSNLSRLTGEREQAGIVFLPEKLYSIVKYQNKVPDKGDDPEKMLYKLKVDIITIFGQGSCSVNPTLFGRTLFVGSEEYPIMHDVLLNMAYQDYRLGGSMTDHWQVVRYLKDHSLKDALQDHALPSEVVRNIVLKKSEELFSHLMLRIKREAFWKFYMDSIASEHFVEVPLDVCYRKFQRAFGFSLDSIVERWYNTKGLPCFDIREFQAFQFEGKDAFAFSDIFCRFKVFNRSDVPGIIMTKDMQGWIIPPREGKEIKVRNRKDIGLVTNNYSLNMPLAENFPCVTSVRLEKPDGVLGDTVTGIFNLDSITFFQNNNEIIVDNEDPGFRIIKAKGFNIVSLFRDEEGPEEYQARAGEPATWKPVVDNNFYGMPVRSAFYKRAGSGKSHVEWNAVLPQPGEYEVFFYHTKPVNTVADPKQEFYYTICSGEEKYDVIAAVDSKETGWVSLGVFPFSKEAKIILSDKDRKDKFETKYGSLPQELVADAIKWVKQ